VEFVASRPRSGEGSGTAVGHDRLSNSGAGYCSLFVFCGDDDGALGCCDGVRVGGPDATSPPIIHPQKRWILWLRSCAGCSHSTWCTPLQKKEGYLTFYHYNRWHLSDYHFNGAKYIFTIDVVKEIHFYHFCSRGTPAQLNSSDLS
jgi:hypothetical protein